MKSKFVRLLLIGICICAASSGCDYAAEGFQDGVEDFVAESTRTALEMIFRRSNG